MNSSDLLQGSHAHMEPAKALAGLDAAEALRKLPGAPHSIADLLAHMNFWQSWFLKRCGGEAEPPAAHAADGWPSVTTEGYPALHAAFLDGLKQVAALESLDRHIDPPISEVPFLASYTIQDALIHVATHNAHHLGQIITLRQLMGLWPPPAGSYTW